MKKRLLACTVVGEKYERIYRAVKPQFEAYAARCKADHAVIREPLDPSGLHRHFTQRLLIPRTFSQYDEVAHLDIDILIPAGAEDIFSAMPRSAAFGAVVDPRGTKAYEKAWDDAPFTRQSHAEYFATKELHSDRPLFSINGGTLLFRTAGTADLFASWYFDTSRHDGKSEYYYNAEEDAAAFLSQDSGLFFALPPRFNRQLLYALCETEDGLRARSQMRSFANRVRRRIARAVGRTGGTAGGMKLYAAFTERLLKEGNIVHFSASYPIPRVDPALLMR